MVEVPCPRLGRSPRENRISHSWSDLRGFLEPARPSTNHDDNVNLEDSIHGVLEHFNSQSAALSGMDTCNTILLVPTHL